MLEVLGQSAVSIQPCQRPLYDPTAWKDHETPVGIGPFDDLEGPFADPAQRLPEFVASIAAIGKHMAQPREAVDDLGQHQRCAVAVLDVGGVDHGVDQVALSVGDDVALAALDLLARIIATRTPGFGGFNALAVDDPGTGRGIAPGRLAPDQQ